MARILVVDDEPDIQMLTRINLERDGHEVLTASNGAEALEAVSDSPPEVIVLDIMMPEVDGWTVLTELKSRHGDAASEIPVILLTALGSPLDRAKGGIEGAVRYLTKPIDLDELRSAVMEALQEPEPGQRRRAQERALELLARMESDAPAADGGTSPRPRLSGLERGPAPPRPAAPSPVRSAAEHLDTLTEKQRELLEAIQAAPTVMEAAAALKMSRSNIYASLRRISRKLGTRSVRDLLEMVRSGELLT